jgi:hypothetical protein
VVAGTTVTATGTGWWGGGTGSDVIPAGNVKVGGVAATTAALKVTSPVYSIGCGTGAAPAGLCTGTLTPATLSGTFVIPNGVTLPATVTIDQPNTPPTPCIAPAPVCFTGNGPGGTVEGTASTASIAQATVSTTGTGLSVWNGNVPNNALTNSTNPPNQNQFWQPAAGVTGNLTYQVSLGGATTVSAVSTTWYAGFAPPTGYTIDTSPDGTTWTTQVTVSGNTSKVRTDVFPGGQVPNTSFLRLNGITGFASTACGGCLFSGIALVQFGWDGHGVVFPQAIAGCTTPAVGCSPNTAVWNSNVPQRAVVNPQDPNVFWQPTSMTANAGTSYEVDLGASKTINSVTASWYAGFTPPPDAYTIQTSPDGVNFTTQATVTGNTSKIRTDVFPGGTVSASYVRLVINSFPNVGCNLTCPTPYADFALVQLTWNGVASLGAARTVLDGATTVGMPTVTSATADFTSNDVGMLVAGPNSDIPVPAYVGVVNSPTQIGLSSSPTLNLPVNAKGTGTGESITINSQSSPTPPTCLTAAPCGSALLPHGYYPATQPNSATANTTSTWLNRVPDNIINGGQYGTGSFAITAATNVGTTITATVSSTNGLVVGEVLTVSNAAPSTWSSIDGTWTIASIPTATTLTFVVTTAPTGVYTGSSATATFIGPSWWQPVGASLNTGNLILGVALGAPRTVAKVSVTWLGTDFCPNGPGTCSGFNPTSYSIWVSSTGAAGAGTAWSNPVPTGTGCTETPTGCTSTDSFTAVSGVAYVLIWITAWNSASASFGPAANVFALG